MSEKKEVHVLGLSGGRDSAALAIYMRDNYPDIQLQYFFTDTGSELPEVHTYLHKLSGYLGQEVKQLNPDHDFDHWLRRYNHFLPSAQTRWCTRQLKLKPFEEWVKSEYLEKGYTVYSYVAIRGDEDYREGYAATDPNLKVVLPFRDDDIDKAGVIDILDSSGVGLPDYYRWRSRSGCTFCFFQQKIEWVRLMREHPEAFEHAKSLEKNAADHGCPFTWTQGEPLTDLEKPERIQAIEDDFAKRVEREKKLRERYPNPLLEDLDPELEIDELYGVDEGAGACIVCHK